MEAARLPALPPPSHPEARALLATQTAQLVREAHSTNAVPARPPVLSSRPADVSLHARDPSF